VLVLVGGRLIWVDTGWPAHRQEIAEAFGSVGNLYGTPQASQFGDRITFIQTTTNGIGVFVCDTATRQRQIAFEEKAGENGGRQDLAIWPWSPDGRLFLYTRKNIVICQGETGAELAKVSVGNESVKALTWLTPDEFAYVSPAGNLHLVNRQRGNNWQSSQLADVKFNSSSLTALSTNTIAWNRNDGIYAMNLESNATTQIYKVPAGQILDAFAFSRTNGKFLLKLRPAKEANEASLCQLRLGETPEKIATCPLDASAISWVNATSNSYAYICLKSTNSISRILKLQIGLQAESSTLFTNGTVESLTTSSDGRRLFVVGIPSNDLAESIWQYEADSPSKNLKCVVPCTDRPSPYARHVQALHDTLTLTNGRTVDYYLYPPVNLNLQQHKKYPLVIGDTMYQIPDSEHQYRLNGPLWAEAVACCDAYVMIVNRPTWKTGLNEWGENIMEAYKYLAVNQAIDTSHVFLFGVSAETSPLRKLAQERPELWKGLLLLNPVALPQINAMPPGKPAPKILISSGQAEKREDLFNRYQADAGQNGVLVNVLIHSNSTHWIISTTAMRDRTKAIVDFIFDN